MSRSTQVTLTAAELQILIDALVLVTDTCPCPHREALRARLARESEELERGRLDNLLNWLRPKER